MESRSTHHYERRKSSGRLTFGPSTSYKLNTSHHKPIFSARKLGSYNLTNPYTKHTSSISRRDFLKTATIGGSALLIGSTIHWMRSLKVIVNGAEMHIRPNSSIDSLIKKLDLETTYGNYVSVSGKILKKGKGYAWGATINGHEVNPDDEYKIKNGDKIQIGNGRNILEPHSISYKIQKPKVVFSGANLGNTQFVSQWPQTGKKEILFGKETGEKAPGKVIHKLQDLIITTANIKPEGEGKFVALTFDDGPSPHTQQYLDILQKKGAKATFFVMGKNVNEYPKAAKAIVDAKHQIANHTYSNHDLSSLSKKDLQSEIKKCTKAIKDTTGISTNVIRPPFGSFTDKCWFESEGCVFIKTLWTHETYDWKRPGVDKIVENATSNLYNGSIILLHDSQATHEQNIEALPKIIDIIQKEGYQLVTLSQMMSKDPSFSKQAAKGYSSMPKSATWPKKLDETASKEAEEKDKDKDKD